MIAHFGKLLGFRARPSPVESDGSDLTGSLLKFVLKISARHQIGLAAVTTLLFLISTVPLELQRRIINDALRRGDFATIAILAFAYFGVTLVQGGIKLCMNVYRGWVSENATRHLRSTVLSIRKSDEPSRSHGGVDISIILAEAEPIGSFIGISFSQPLLQIGILVSLLSYMTYLEPWMAVIALAGFVPQMFYVPKMQGDINRDAGALHSRDRRHIAPAQQGPRHVDRRLHDRPQRRQGLCVRRAVIRD